MKKVTELTLRRQFAELSQWLAQAALDTNEVWSLTDLGAMAEKSLYHFAAASSLVREPFLFRHASENGIEMIKREGVQGDHSSGRPTGLASLDKRIGGLFDGELTILAGRPGVGKTSLATSIAFNVASRLLNDLNCGNDVAKTIGASVAYFSLKTNADQLAIRILAQQTGASLEALWRGRVGDGLSAIVSEAQRLENLPLYIDDNPAPSIMGLCARARTLKRRHDIRLIVVDCVQLVRTPYCSANWSGGISEVCRELKALADELSLPVIALFETPGSSEDRDNEYPQLSDLRTWGRVETDADAVWFLDRQTRLGDNLQDNFDSAAQAESREEDYSFTSLVIVMHHRGVTGRVRLRLDAASGHLTDPEGEGA